MGLLRAAARAILAFAFTAGRALIVVLPIFVAAGPVVAAEPSKINFAISHPAVGVGEEIYLYFVPKHLGLFAKEGLDVDLKVGGTVILAAQGLENNSFQFATTTAPIILKMREQGGDLIAIDNLKSDPGQQVAVLLNSPIRRLEDIKGRTVGSLEWGSQGGLALMVSLEQLGIGPNDYKRVVTGAGPAAAVALRGGQVDALALWDAVYGAMENGGLSLRYIDMPLARMLSGFSLAVSERYAAANPAAVAGFCRAVNEGLYFARINPSAAVSILLDDFPALVPAGSDRGIVLKNDLHIFERYLANTVRDVPMDGKTGAIPPEVWTYVADYNRKAGKLEGAEPAKNGYTTRFFEACNDFDRPAIAAMARRYGQ
jgi:NitT/TauT family transport system substrate-binding protein